MPASRDLATVPVGRARFRRRPSGRSLAVFVVLVAAAGAFAVLPGLQGAPQAGDSGSERVMPDARPAQGIGEALARSFQGTLAQALPVDGAAGIAPPADFAPASDWPVLAGAPEHMAPLLLLPRAHAQTPDTGAFVTTWNTTGESLGSKSLASVWFHIGVASGGQVSIDWGDGGPPQSYNASGSVDRYYIYDGPPVPRNSTVSISGDLTRFYFHYYDVVRTGDTPEGLLSLDQWGDAKWSDMTGMFRGATNMQYRATDAPDLSSRPSVLNMFYNTYFDGDLSGWDVSSMTSTRYMFNKAYGFDGDLSGWDVSNVTDMTYMFSDAYAFNGDISGWNVSSVERMTQMFQAADSFNGDISGWDVSSVEDMYAMFIGADSFNGDISGWNVSSVDHLYGMSSMFNSATAFDRNLGPWFIVLEDTHV